MKQILPLLVLLPILFVGCNNSNKTKQSEETSRIIVPKPNGETDSGEKTYNDTEMPSDRFFTDDNIRYKVLLSKIIDADNDETNEEILIAKNTTDPEEKELYIIYSSILGNTGDEPLAKTDKKRLNLDTISTIRLETGDFSNKGKNEIAIWGFSSNGNQTLDLVRIEPFFGKMHSIAGINEKGSIEIRFNDKYGYRYPTPKIYVHKDRHEADNSITILRDVYEWDYFREKFHLQQTETMEANTIDKENLYKVYYGTVDDFAEYLSGGWIRINSEENNQAVEILFFSPEENLIYYFGDEIIEGYRWGDSRKLMSNRLFINSGNFLINSQKNTFTVTIHDMETIELASNSKVIDLIGKYQKVNIPLDEILKKEKHEKIPPTLSGLFKNDEQFSILFNLPIVTLYKENKTFTGVAKIFNFKGENVIEFDFPGQTTSSSVGETNTFIFETRESKDSNHQIKTLLLYPATINALRVEKIPADAVQIEQIETTASPKEE